MSLDLFCFASPVVAQGSQIQLQRSLKTMAMDKASPEDSSGLKKGAWTKEEDDILAEYVQKYGAKDWSSVCSRTALVGRCGKSCRLRWVNHLRPNLRKDAFTPQEEQLVIELQAKHGNRWAMIASHLKGRTDNCVKNLWNTRLRKKRQAQQGRSLLGEGIGDAFGHLRLKKTAKLGDKGFTSPLNPLWASEMDFGITPLLSPSSTLDYRGTESALLSCRGLGGLKGEAALCKAGSSVSTSSRNSHETIDLGSMSVDQLASCDSTMRAAPIDPNSPFVGMRQEVMPQICLPESSEGGMNGPQSRSEEARLQRQRFIESLRLQEMDCVKTEDDSWSGMPNLNDSMPVATPSLLPTISPLNSSKLGVDWLHSPGFFAPPITPGSEYIAAPLNTPRFFSPPPMSPMMFDALRTPNFMDFQLSPITSRGAYRNKRHWDDARGISR